MFGTNVKKVAEDYISRLVESWQISQPLHLRRLSIVRDTVLKGKSQIYVYYTFTNFQRLVDEGRGFWEAVTTVPDDVREGNNTIAALDAQPDLDEYGFPKLNANDFQGRFNDTTLADVASALNVGPLPIGYKDPILKQTADGKYGTVVALILAMHTYDDIGIVYRKAMRRPTAPGDVHQLNKTISAPSQSHLIKPQVSGTLKPQQSSPGRPVSVKPRTPVGPKRPLSTPLKPIAVEPLTHQTPISERRYVRKDNKPLGRPRKYPKTGVPENIESMSVEEIGKMRDSQEMAEKYEKTQLENEILRCIEEGKDPVSVTGQVLAAADDLRKREGEDPIPEATRSRILYDFAGGPEPDPANTIGMNWISKLPPAYRPRNPMRRRPKERPYLPSMAAHSYPTHVPRRRLAVTLKPVSEKRADEVAVLTNRTRRKRIPVPDLRTLLGKRPDQEDSPVPAPIPAAILSLRHVMRYLPSVAAHSWPKVGACFQAPKDAVPRQEGPPRKAVKSIVAQSQDSSSVNLSVASHPASCDLASTTTIAKRRRGPNKPKVIQNGIDEGDYPGWVHFMSKYYEPQLQSIARPHDGIFLGNTMPRRKRPGEPGNLRPQELKLVFFKSARLKEFDWFVPQARPCKTTVNRRKPQSPALTAVDLIASSDVPLTPRHTLTVTHSIEPTSISEALTPVLPQPSNVSEPIAGNGTKRKRRDSSQPPQGTPLVIPVSRCSPPRMGSFTVTEKSRTLLQSANIPRLLSSPTALSRLSSPRIASSAATQKPKADFFSANIPQDTPLPISIFEHSSPRTGSSTLIAKSRANVESGHGPPAFGEDDGDTTSEDEGLRRTPETSKDVDTCVPELIVANSIGLNPGKVKVTSQTPKPLVTEGIAGLENILDRNSVSPQTSPNPSITASRSMEPPTRKALVPTKKSFGHMSRQGGSSAILRKNIIMSLVEQCGGVFPNHREMSKPFAVEWRKKGQEGYPEPKTLQNAVTALCSENKIRRITFTAQTSQGLVVTKDIIVSASVENADLRVKELQTRMVAAHPRLYLPIAVMPLNDPHSIYGQGPKERNEESEDASGTEAGTEPRIKSKARRRRRRNSQGELVDLTSDLEKPSPNTTRTGRFVPAKLSSSRTSNILGSVGKVQRLATLQNMSNASMTRSRPTSSPGLLPTANKGLTWLSSEYAFSEHNFEDERPTILEPAIIGDTHRRYDRYATIMDPPAVKRSKDPKEQAKRRMRGMAQKAAQIKRRQARAKGSRPSLLYSDFESSTQRCSKISELRSSFSSRSTSVDNVERPEAGLEDIEISAAAINSGRLSPASGRITPSQSAEGIMLKRQPNTLAETLKTRPYVRSFLVGFMDPLHFFHKQNGTFSVTFAGLQPPRKIIAHRGTCVYPYTTDLKTVNPVGKRQINATLDAAGRHHSLHPLQERFVEEVDDLLEWELNTPELQGILVKSWPIINYDFPHTFTTAETIAAKQKAATGQTISSKDERPTTGHGKYGKRLRKVSFAAADALDSEPETPLKRRRLLSVAKRYAEGEITELDSRSTKYRRVRGPRSAKYLGENGEQRLLTAVMVIRTLTGGIDKQIDWVLVAKVFEPDYDQMFVHGRWNYVSTKYKLMVPKWESDFQDLFAQAYEEGTVPAMDFDDLEGYDWKWLVEWVMAKIDTAFQSQPELPAQRDQFEDLYAIKETSEIDVTDFYEFDRMLNTKKRTHTIIRSAYVIPLEEAYQPPASKEAEQLSVARSWVRANVITSEETYSPVAARAKLSMVPESIVEDALKQLLLDKTLMQQNKGRLVPGRNYDISEFLLDRLRKRLPSAQFQRAIAFKRQLDRDFATIGSHPYSYKADDGDVLAVFNLMANKRITAVSIKVPMNKWGLTDGYESRLMDKKRLKFDVELRPLPEYVEGNPLAPYPPPPSQHLQDPNAKIPIWYDIHGSLVPVMWEMVLAAVLCILAMRPGAGAGEIEKAVRPALQDWEVQSVLVWLVEAKVAKIEGIGYCVDEWWWLALGVMEDLVGAPDENNRRSKGKGKAVDADGDDMIVEFDD